MNKVRYNILFLRIIHYHEGGTIDNIEKHDWLSGYAIHYYHTIAMFLRTNVIVMNVWTAMGYIQTTTT